jgi:hypothetical protein
MAWEWSHSQEAYAAVKRQLDDKAESAAGGDREAQEWLLVVTAEWAMGEGCRLPYAVWLKRYKKAMRAAAASVRRGPDAGLGWQNLADAIWDKSEAQATCDNGGWNAWVCPDGCHTLPFTHPDEASQDQEEYA